MKTTMNKAMIVLQALAAALMALLAKKEYKGLMVVNAVAAAVVLGTSLINLISGKEGQVPG